MVTATEIKKTVHIEQNRRMIAVIAKKDMPEYGIRAGQKFYLLRVGKFEYEVKTIAVTNRQVSDEGTVTSTFTTNDGKSYEAKLRLNGDNSCGCPAKRGTCYHVGILLHLKAQRTVRYTPRKLEVRGELRSNASPMELIKAA